MATTITLNSQSTIATKGIDFAGKYQESTYSDGVFHTGVKGSIIAKSDSTYTLNNTNSVFLWPLRPDGTISNNEPIHLILELVSYSIKASSQTFLASEYVELSTTIIPEASSISQAKKDLIEIYAPHVPGDPYNLAPASFNWEVMVTYTTTPNPTLRLRFNTKKLSESSIVKGFYYIY